MWQVPTIPNSHSKDPKVSKSQTLSNIFIINWILSLTLAPPKMAKTGVAGASNTLAKASNSFPQL